MRRRSRYALTALLVITDAGMVVLAFYLSYLWRVRTQNPPAVNILPFQGYAGMMAIQVVTMLAIFTLTRLYHLKRGMSRLDELTRVIGGISIGTLISTAATSFVYKNELDYPRLMLIYSWFLTCVLVSLGRLLHERLRSAMRRHGVDRAVTLIVGTGEVPGMILNKIRQSPHLGYEVAGFVANDESRTEAYGLPVLGRYRDLPRLIDTLGVDQVIIGLPERPREEILEIVGQCQRGNVEIKVFPDVFQIMASEISIGDLSGLPLVVVRDIALRGWKLTLKRAFDLVGSAVALVVLSPFLLFLAMLVKLESRGPVFYVQERVGLDGKPFMMVKFRSMRQDAEANGPGWTVNNDPRRTRLGVFLRRYNLDELPQLINVLLGEMSLVGPRPERPVYVEQFREVVPRYMERHREKAGLTGWAQINGLRGDTSIAERTKYDLWYVENWSLGLDLKILLLTLLRSGSRNNAY